jgi:Family of unknown function (DUF5681)
MKPPGKFNAYVVGYKKPPKGTRFAPGRSGNPSGRPKKHLQGSMTDGTIDKLTAVVLDEAYREVEIVENGVKIKMPIVQAAVRSVAVNAAKGDRKAQDILLRTVAAMEGNLLQVSLEAMQAAIDYKEGWEQHKREATWARSTPVEPVPHPDDIVIDTVGRRILINGPRDEHEKARWDAAAEQLLNSREVREELQEDLGHATEEERDSLERLIRQNEICIAVYEAAYPDETTRRQPGFDLQAWRDDRADELKCNIRELKRLRRTAGSRRRS